MQLVDPVIFFLPLSTRLKEMGLPTSNWCDCPSTILLRSTSLAAMLDPSPFLRHVSNVPGDQDRRSLPTLTASTRGSPIPCGQRTNVKRSTLSRQSRLGSSLFGQRQVTRQRGCIFIPPESLKIVAVPQGGLLHVYLQLHTVPCLIIVACYRPVSCIGLCPFHGKIPPINQQVKQKAKKY